jgi:NADPH:quinone reductase
VKRRIVFRRTGGPEVLETEELGELAPGAGEILIRHEAIGVNFIDTYHRSGLYPQELPSGLGSEAAGMVEAVGDQVTGFRVGDRVGYFSGPVGAYASHRVTSAKHVVHLPAGIDPQVAAAVMLKGCTAEYLIERCARVAAGEAVLVHAAAGGTGSILVPWLKEIGATVIAHAGSEAKAIAAGELGADHTLSCPMDSLAGEVRRLTGGRGADKILDGVGAASWQASLGAVARRGLLVSFGNASGPVPPFSALDLTRAGSIFVTRPTLGEIIAEPGEMQASADRLFAMIERGAVRPNIGRRYGLEEAGEAHRALESRETTGSTILLP